MNAMVAPVYQLLPFLEYLPIPRNWKLQQSVDHMYNLLEGAIQEREKERERDRASGVTERKPRDLLDLLIPLSKGLIARDFHFRNMINM